VGGRIPLDDWPIVMRRDVMPKPQTPEQKKAKIKREAARKKSEDAYLKLANDESLSEEEFLKKITPAQRKRFHKEVADLVRLAHDTEVYGGSQVEFD
jgi:hypothetical protein